MHVLVSKEKQIICYGGKQYIFKCDKIILLFLFFYGKKQNENRYMKVSKFQYCLLY